MRNALILGSGRSGTSMVAGSLAKAGYFMGERLYPARDSNPLGFFEDPEINGVNEELLAPHVPADQGLAAPQRWLARLDRSVEAPLPRSLEARARALVGRAPFCFKDPRFCYTLPAWRPLLADTRFVCVFRDPAVTAASIVKECASNDYLRGVAMDPARALALWCDMHREVLRRHRHQGDWLFLHYDQVVEGDGLRRLGEFLGAPVDAGFPTGTLRRSRAKETASPEAKRLYAELCELAGHSSQPAVAVPAPKETPAISVLICTYDRKQTLLECLQSFSQQTLGPQRYEIVVVVDGSGDGSAQAVRDFKSRAPITLIERARNAGLSSARSAAVAAARGEIVLFVNDDTIAQPDLLERHLAAHARRAPKPVSVLGTFEQPAEQLGTALMRVLERTQFVFGYAGLRADVDHDWMKFWGCNVSVPRREVLEAGAFDASFRHYGCEDTDLGVRLQQRGLPVVHEPAARAWHRHVLTFADLKRRQQTVARAYVRLFAKHPHTLAHPAWRGRADATVASLDDFVARRAADRERIEQLAAELAASASEAADMRLEVLLNALNQDWWCTGFAQGLRELGFGSMRELRETATRALAAEPWPLAGSHPVRVLAWPKWDDDQELGELLALAADPRLGVAAPCLCLRHDPRTDGPLEAATRRLTKASERVLQRGEDVSVLLIGEPIAEPEWPRLGRAVTCALRLDSSEQGERARFFARCGAPGVRGVEDLLAYLPATPLAAVSAPARRPAIERVWAELSV